MLKQSIKLVALTFVFGRYLSRACLYFCLAIHLYVTGLKYIT